MYTCSGDSLPKILQLVSEPFQQMALQDNLFFNLLVRYVQILYCTPTNRGVNSFENSVLILS